MPFNKIRKIMSKFRQFLLGATKLRDYLFLNGLLVARLKE